MAGFFDGLYESTQNPLFLGGIGLMTGGFEGMQQGMQTGAGLQDRMKKQQQQASFIEALKGMPGVDQNTMHLLQADPEFARTFAANALSPKQTDDQREYNLARQQGFKGGFMDYQVALKRAGAQQTNIDLKQEGAYDKEIGGLLAKEFVKSQEQGSNAERDIADLEVLNKSIENPNVYMGTGGNQVQAVKKAAQSVFGLDVQGVADGEVIQKTSAKAALGLKDNLPGPMSDSDRKFLMDLPANLSTSPEGARRVVALGVAQKRWQAERAAAARSFASKNGGRLTPEVYGVLSTIDRKYSQTMSGMVESLRGQAQSAPRAPTSGTGLDGLRKKYQGLE